jgi:hypothetical protein
MDQRSRIRTYLTASAVAGLTAAAVVVAPTLAAGNGADNGATTTTGTSTATTTTPKHDRPCPGGPKAGPAALRVVGAALRPDPPANGKPPAGGPKPGAGQNGTKPTPPTAAQKLERRAAHFAAIGKPLGKSGDEVAAAVRSTLKDTLDARVTAGKLKQAREDALLKAWDAGEGAGPAGRPGPGAPPPPATNGTKKQGKRANGKRRLPRAAIQSDVTAFRAGVAKALGVSVDDLVKAIDAAKPAKGQSGP